MADTLPQLTFATDNCRIKVPIRRKAADTDKLNHNIKTGNKHLVNLDQVLSLFEPACVSTAE